MIIRNFIVSAFATQFFVALVRSLAITHAGRLESLLGVLCLAAFWAVQLGKPIREA